MIYRITEQSNNPDGLYYCECSVQDGTQSWYEDNLDLAISSVVVAARTLNGSFIRRDEVEIIRSTDNSANAVYQQYKQLIDKVESGKLIVLNHDDPRITYRLSDDELQMIIDIREGKKIVVQCNN